MSSLPLPPPPATCIAEGTYILTEKGNVLIEDLRAGHRLATLNAGFAPVKWIGRRKIDFRGLSEAEAWLNQPVFFSKSSLAEQVPFCDLTLSRCHAVLCRGLNAAGNMVNGKDIRALHVDEITYYHVEVERFEFIVANGLGVESYRDVGNRYLFEDYLQLREDEFRKSSYMEKLNNRIFPPPLEFLPSLLGDLSCQ